MGSSDPQAKGQFLGERTHRACVATLCRELCKMAEPNDMPLGLSTRVSRRKHVFVEGQVGATLRIRLNRSCAAMRPYDKFYFDHLFSHCVIVSESCLGGRFANGHDPGLNQTPFLV